MSPLSSRMFFIMKKITDFTVSERCDFDRVSMLVLHSQDELPDILPGQFMQVRADGAKNTYLRRPISVHDVDYEHNNITLLVQRVGEGTKAICDSEIGSVLNVVYPLGNGFSVSSDWKSVLLVGGGIGAAPLLYLAKMMKIKGLCPLVLLGGKTKNDIIRIDEYRKYADVMITTDDGSLGEKGFVSQHSVWGLREFDHIAVCGPLPMMKSVAAIARQKNTDCEVSLENMMACGLGACLCCVENTKEGNLCVCKEGPVFNINRLLW